MFFDTNDFYVSNISVYHLSWKKSNAFTKNDRPFNALSYRVNGNATFTHNNKKTSVKSGDVIFTLLGAETGKYKPEFLKQICTHKEEFRKVISYPEYIAEENPDFTFLYLGHVDSAGHNFGWMSVEYMDAIDKSWKNIDRIVSTLPEDYAVIITADHGGHDRTHGTEMAEDLLIPIMIV